MEDRDMMTGRQWAISLAISFLAPAMLVMGGCSGGGDQAASGEAEAGNMDDIPDAEQLVGGWQDGQVTDEVRAAADFALNTLDDKNLRVKSIEAVKQQVVAGMNYDIWFKASNDTLWNAIVYVDLEQNMQLTDMRNAGEINESAPDAASNGDMSEGDGASASDAPSE